jgi:LAO/AO transport system kinase
MFLKRGVHIPARSFATGRRSPPDVHEMAQKLVGGQRAALSRAITMVESRRPQDKQLSHELLGAVAALRQGVADASGPTAPFIAPPKDPKKGEEVGTAERPPHQTGSFGSFRLGIAGPPGAGKSTFVEALGEYLTRERLHKLAVVAIDPSSSLTGGSILGDKTRMTTLSANPNAFVRPCPTGGTLGGVAQHTNEVVTLCEAGGHDIVVVETVGLGQSEIAIHDTVDMLMLLVPPAGGDELQGVKKGIMELVDLVVVNKADGDLLAPARHSATDFMHSLQLTRRKSPNWAPVVKLCSALEKTNISGVWHQVELFREAMEASGELDVKRRRQSMAWAWTEVQHELMDLVRRDESVKKTVGKLEAEMARGHLTPRQAAAMMIDKVITPRQ